MRPYILAESNWRHIKETDFSVAVLPWGATEAHNYHLPYGTDIIEAEAIAAESARIAWERGTKVTVLPAIPFGVNTGQADIKLDININPSTQLVILQDIVETLNRQNIRKLLLVNSHGGNDFKPILRELGLRYPKMLLVLSNWYQHPIKKDYFENIGDHADEVETSLILHLAPDLVAPLEQAGPGEEKRHRMQAFREGLLWTERKWSQVTEDTGIGNPKLATSEKGEAFFRTITQKLAEGIIELAALDQEDMYV